MTYYTLEEMLDEDLGKIGTPVRDEFEREVEEAHQAYLIGEEIKKARLEQHLTQEQLGKKAGICRTKVSKIEKGGSASIFSLARVCKALGIPVSFKIGNTGEVAFG